MSVNDEVSPDRAMPQEFKSKVLGLIWSSLTTEEVIEEISTAHAEEVRRAVEEFREKVALMTASLCGLNPHTRRPCFIKEPNQRYWCPVCVKAGEIRALSITPPDESTGLPIDEKGGD